MVQQVADAGKSLSTLLARGLEGTPDPRERALTQELTFGTLRWYHRLESILGALLRQRLKAKDRDLHALLLVGLYQLLVLRLTPHAAVHETVEAARQLGKPWAAGLVNGVLRNAQRGSAALAEAAADDPVARWSYPRWWIRRLQKDWPDHWQEILEAGNQRPPMVLRVNRLHSDRPAYLARLEGADIAARPLDACESAVLLETAVSVDRLPGFESGVVSVQDAAAQLVAEELAPQAGQRILDACAAPGGKTGHILELAPELELYAVDSDARRSALIRDNLHRLGMRAKLVVGDAAAPQNWWDGRQFDRILLDAPCSASGVVRRHPDIKLLRRAPDVQALAAKQQQLLAALWPLLAPGGILLYVTCSVFKAENAVGVQAFVARCADSREAPMKMRWGIAQSVGRQILPGQMEMDGFYLARLTKLPAVFE
jgi:16S rRNA (cytosine967-C5)-methyltransferase